MQLQHIFNEINRVDPELPERMSSRRHAMKSFAGIGAKIGLAAMPFLIGSIFKKAYAQSGPSQGAVLEVLNYALTLEYLEAEFYAMGISKGTALVPAGAPANAIKTIGDHEAAHVSFLKTAITAAGATPVAKPNFDFTADGTFADVFTNYATFLAVAQTFEDTGVRAYKGRAAELTGGGDLLTAALNIHSVEARHAAHIRSMRKANNFGNVKPWITGKESGIGAVVQASYDGEELTTQAGVNIVNINGTSISAAAASEAFDEGLTKEQVLSIVGPFIVQ
ncbi:ferritin-like domain-containing protein [Flavihumibacter sp. CACIAM 22H1]|uniref:ferritin-like domain-containing protein n=1 Tax=Flavihumibacter sp. CACIAM 22H1 TaxID=1812911 RepID=UPI0007A872CF|nr:ferritin-like domain-containing protein [Flavihumibacter sp. CACIAM 22H1]KYP14995.1 MAG: dessication-associated protein [Flavihumibacter sp. CACIAM 22H1]